MLVSESIVLDALVLGSLTLSALAMVIAFACVSRMRKQAALTQKLYQRLEHNLQISNSSAVGVGKRLIAIEKAFKRRQADDSPVVQAPVSNTGLSTLVVDDELKDAASLLHAGIDPEEVSRRCGISRAEASLLKMMHSQVHEAA
ncbi:MAG: DUF2802 domain-containing protein [Cellvibrionaceae bacterium]